MTPKERILLEVQVSIKTIKEILQLQIKICIKFGITLIKLSLMIINFINLGSITFNWEHMIVPKTKQPITYTITSRISQVMLPKIKKKVKIK